MSLPERGGTSGLTASVLSACPTAVVVVAVVAAPAIVAALVVVAVVVAAALVVATPLVAGLTIGEIARPSSAGAAGTPGIRFTDVTRLSGIHLALTSGGTPSREILEVNGGGVSLFDCDNDGDLDLFFANGATMDDPEHGPGSRLYLNNGDGTFVDVSEKAGVSVRRWAMGVAAGDFDGDGYDDLYVTCFGRNVLLRNDTGRSGRPRFVDVTDAAGVGDDRWSTSAAFGDVDGDGDLDLYVANYLEFDPRHPPDRSGVRFLGVPVMAGPSGLKPQDDALYENLGDGRFRDASRRSGCLPRRSGYGLVTAIFDADGDGRQDIFVGNDTSENFLFHNEGGDRFREVGVTSGLCCNGDGEAQATMGIAIADVDGNGLPDVFTTAFSSDTNTLHLNLGRGLFEDATARFGLAAVSRPFLSWGAGFFDFDLDGDEDLFVSNGHVYPEASGGKLDASYEQEPLLFERRGARFERSLDAGEMFRTRYPGRSCAFGDIDGDGDVDIVMTALNAPVRIFRNDSAGGRRVVVELEQGGGNHRALGAKVALEACGGVGTPQTRWIHGGSFQSSDAPAAYFGIDRFCGAAPVSIRVTWPQGGITEHSAPSDRRIVVNRRRGTVRAMPLRQSRQD